MVADDRYLPGDLPPSRQKRSDGRGSPESSTWGSSRGRAGSRDRDRDRERERDRTYKGGDKSVDKYGGRGHMESPSARKGKGGRGEGRNRDSSPPSRGSEGSGGRGGRGGRGKPRRGEGGADNDSPRGSKKPRYTRDGGGGGQKDEEEDFDYERFTGAALHEGHEAFGGAGQPQPEGPARPPQDAGRGQGDLLGGGGRGGRWVWFWQRELL